ncbi:MAG: hypothetical protein QOF09_3405 [Alphaproteobacteria bacterium]|jgi:hypothetical protein|nr:hypothetical protein [Alphaproteobacteria bacterium]
MNGVNDERLDTDMAASPPVVGGSATLSVTDARQSPPGDSKSLMVFEKEVCAELLTLSVDH